MTRETKPLPGVYGTERVTDVVVEGSTCAASIDWLALGCPDRFHLALGDRVVTIAVPEGFPERPLEHVTRDLEVYGRKQSFGLASAAGASARHVRLTLDAAGLDVPLTLLCQDGPLFDGEIAGPIQTWRGPLLDASSDGTTRGYVYLRILRGVEKDIANGAACRPEGRATAILTSRWETPMRVVDTHFEDREDFQLETRTFEWEVRKTWVVYICTAGQWVRLHAMTDTVTRRYVREYRWF
jgi:hypothetical protein